MKKHLTKIIASLMLVVFMGLLSFSLTPQIKLNESHHNDGMQCFGAGCGPVEHMAMHSYTLASVSIQIKINHHPQFLLAEEDKIYNPLAQRPESPPPKFF